MQQFWSRVTNCVITASCFSRPLLALHQLQLLLISESGLGMQMEEEEWRIKPMNCPLHVNIYNSTQHSYRNLPLRFAELGTVYRYERSGTLHGLFRVRGFTQVLSSFCKLTWVTNQHPGGSKGSRLAELDIEYGFWPGCLWLACLLVWEPISSSRTLCSSILSTSALMPFCCTCLL